MYGKFSVHKIFLCTYMHKRIEETIVVLNLLLVFLLSMIPFKRPPLCATETLILVRAEGVHRENEVAIKL